MTEPSDSNEEIRWDGAMPCDQWVEYAKEYLKPYFEREVVVVSLIGKDFPNRKKFDELNDFLRLEVFPCPSTSKQDLHAEMYYSSAKNIVFILVNSSNDVAPLKSAFKKENIGKTFFEKLEELEAKYLSMLHFASLVSQIMIFLEPYPRVDMALVRCLKNVNKIRIAGQNDIADLFRQRLSSNHGKAYFILDRDGRLCTPKFLFAFQKTVIRNELGTSKRKEIMEKLEESLEDQIYNVFKQCKLIGSTISLGSIPSKMKFARLLFPSAANETILADILDFILDKKMPENEEDPICDLLPKLINQNVSALRKDKDRSHPLPTLELVVDLVSLLNEQTSEQITVTETTKKIVQREQKLQKELTQMAIDDAFEKYSWQLGRERERSVLTKAEHNQRFGAAVRCLDGVLVGSRDAAIAELRSKCDNLWLHGGLQCCEQQSVTGYNCHLPIHSCIGDESVSEKEWEMHDSGITFISTCACGRTQTIRRDPFTVKEANYDYYFVNNDFPCCKTLERHNFTVNDMNEVEEEPDEAWHAEENWPRPGDEAQPSFPRRRISESSSGTQESVSSAEENTSSSSSGESSDEDSDGNKEYGGTRRSYARKGTTKETGVRRQSAVSEFIKKMKDLEAKNIPHIVGVPHSLTPGLLPVFPSWSLTCIGPGSLYSHALGLRDQPNFKISSEFLLPVDIPLQVDRERWEQDLDFVNAVEGVGMYTKYRPNRRPGLDVEKVKLFVGFDYECPRGHRFFVDSEGEPLLLPKGHNAREQACREAGVNIMSADLPLRRQCTCRKLPNQTAQLMKIHIVTPKSPVTVTIEPKIFIPNQEGYFCTGEEPLKLAWAKYYILHLPFVYSGPDGLWIPPRTFDRVGTYKGNSINVCYTPLEKK